MPSSDTMVAFRFVGNYPIHMSNPDTTNTQVGAAQRALADSLRNGDAAQAAVWRKVLQQNFGIDPDSLMSPSDPGSETSDPST